MRRRFLVLYDVSSPHRLRRVHKTMKAYGFSLQLSVFLCRLSPTDRIRMEGEIRKHLNGQEDQAIILDLGPERSGDLPMTVISRLPVPEPPRITVF
jgi:CRISPR-associated protein Cas2